ncbi:GNAT family N-acetyltransferase [Listeria newyorkensis]|uniref:GNAT family N-acetyltransferase n=1 Tax=Listeria newyorkensis TaxID=1497681 RepID=A0ABX4XRX9_9LIST|nr:MULTISPECIES: GNAT family N-acetyltransferase [Listeria]KGL42090.1 acetyltransferase [Listeriaceae bacterium FSL A5-0209]KGL38311.1 acetyltransferase [Listeria newyorkensis]KMT62896.1 acetyltransferase [Listeria newyorkensis]PNP94423.1 GNAT family N-acetyltransferase [Listeria newyorkensis]RQW67611.1 GNAT family N-acetyltransferase [Listeria sp. SHR_NRA_18]
MEIRLLTTADVDQYVKIRLQALQESPAAFATSFEEEKYTALQKYEIRFQSPYSLTFGAFSGGNLVGVVTLIREERIKTRHRANIVAMYVAPERRGSGVGKALIGTAIEQAQQLEGIEQVYLSVVTNNKQARKLYTSLGFVPYSLEKRALKLDGTYFDEEHMVLFL